MKQLLVLFALFALGTSSVWKGGFRIRFDVGINYGGSFFYDIPRTRVDAIRAGWRSRTQPDGLPAPSLSLYCYLDNVVCIFTDTNGDVAGMQVALNKEKFTPHYDMEESGFTSWDVDGESFWTLQQYFDSPENLSARSGRLFGGENENKIIEKGGVWVVGTHKEVVRISNSTDEIASEGLFTRQACIPWMGRHYYYKMTTSLSCTDEPLFPWFPLVESGELIATGFVVPGTLLHAQGTRNWFEDPNRTAVKAIVPDGPECLYELADTPGLVTMHIYYINQPWLVSCIFQ